ncbi:HEAT repeat domain-containing protein [Vibrio tritonius]|uniref:HEAT repeat domain-containing protein n=1 Tax=Vibrio tritonius TaxID=1435069 RepID=UPI00315D5E60
MVLIKQNKTLVSEEIELEDVQLAPLTSVANIQPQLKNGTEEEKIAALHDLDLFDSQAILPLLEDIITLIENEESNYLGEVAFSSLRSHLCDEVVQKLTGFLASESPFIRNQAIELLQNAPELLAPYMSDLIHNSNPDVRIFAVDILGLLPHDGVPNWLREILRKETHVNVIGAAIDRITQLADPSLLEDVKQAQQRFSAVAYIQFACKVAIDRLTSEG